MYKTAYTANNYPAQDVNSEGWETLDSPKPKYAWSGALRLACPLDIITNPLCPKRQWPTGTRQDLQSNRSDCPLLASWLFCHFLPDCGSWFVRKTNRNVPGTFCHLGMKRQFEGPSYSHVQLCLLSSTVAAAVTRPGKSHTCDVITLHSSLHPLGWCDTLSSDSMCWENVAKSTSPLPSSLLFFSLKHHALHREHF